MFARLSAIGNTWQRGQPGDPSTLAVGGGSATVKSVSNVDDPAYLPIFRAGGDAQGVFNDLYGSVQTVQQQNNTSNIQESALELDFSALTAGTTVFTQRTFTRALDLSQHRNLNFLLYGSVDGVNYVDKTFFLRAGAGQDFFEIRVPLRNLQGQGWQKIVVNQDDKSGNQIPNSWSVGQGPPGTVVVSSGNPNLQQIPALVAGIYSASSTTTSGKIWLDEIYVSNPITRKGQAEKLQVDMTVPRWASFGAKHRSVDHNYQTPTTVITNQDNRQDNAYLNIDRLNAFPMHFTLARAVTNTPNTNATSDLSNLVSLLQQGKVTAWNGTANGAFTYGSWPKLNLSYTRNLTNYDLLTRNDDKKTYAGTLDYSVPGKKPWLPQSVGLNYSYAKNSVSFDSPRALSLAGDYNTDEFTNSVAGKLAFAPWSGSAFSPNYTLTTVKESRSDFSTGQEIRDSYHKSMNQTAGFTGNFRLLKWLNPSVNYSISTIENNNLQPAQVINGSVIVTTFTVANSTDYFRIGALKTVNRTANGGINLTLSASEILPRSKLLRTLSLTNGYQLQDGDVYTNVADVLDTHAALWLRTPLRAAGAVAQRTNLTLRDTYNSSQRWSPLEAYDISGRKSAFKTLAITNNYVKSLQRSEITGTQSKVISTTLPDMIASLSKIEQVLFAEHWMRNGQVNLKYASRRTETVAQNLASDDAVGADMRALILERYDTSLSFNLKTSDSKDLVLEQSVQSTKHVDLTLQSTFDRNKYRFTPKVDYQHDVTTLGTGVDTANTTVLTPSLLVRSDMSLPRGLRLPFSGKTLAFTNRIIWTTTLSLALRQSPITEADNSKLFNLNTSADYELAKNLRMTLNGAVSRLWHKYLKEEEYISYQFGTMLTFQF